MIINIYDNLNLNNKVINKINFDENGKNNMFTFFNLCNVSPKAYDHLFIVAEDEKDVFGILKFSNKKLFGEKIWSISWLDVNCNYRNIGIANKLLKELNSYLENKDIIVFTDDFTELGELYIKNKMEKTLINAKNVITNIDDFMKLSI